jgi:tetratricopeptide (TPR) repeat protein
MEGNYDAAATCAEEALSIARESEGAPDLLCEASRLLGVTRTMQRRYAAAGPLLEESLALFEAQGNAWCVAGCHFELGDLAYLEGDNATARVRYDDSLVLFRQLEDALQSMLVTCGLEAVLEKQPDEKRATLLHDQQRALVRSMRDAAVLARVGMMLLNVADHWLYHYGDEPQARTLYRQGLRIWQELHTVDRGRALVVKGLAGLADVAAARQQAQRAGRLFGVADRLLPIGDGYRDRMSRRLEDARARLDPGPFAAGWAAGQAMTDEQGANEALA